MNTKNKNICHCEDDNLIKIIVHETPQTSTLQRVVDTLSVLDASITEITGQQISAIRDSLDDLSTNFYDFSTSASVHFSTLDSSVAALDASIKSLTVDSIAGLNARFEALSTKTDDISTRLDASVTDVSNRLSLQISDVSNRLSDASVRINKNTSDISDISTRLYHTISNVADTAARIADVSLNTLTNTSTIANVSTRLSEYISDYDGTVLDVSALKTLTANHTSELNKHDASIQGLAAALETANSSIATNTASIAALGADLQSVDASVSDISTRLASNITTLSSNVADNAANIADVSLSTQTNTASISDVSTRFAAHLNDHDSTVADVSALKTLTASHTIELNKHDASILALSDGLLAANSSISALRNDVSTVDNKIVIYDTSLRSDVSTLATTLTTHLNEFDTSVRNHFASLDDSVGYLRTERNRLDASIVSLTNYIDTTVTTILSEDRARINAIESLAIDTSVYVHDTLTAYNNRLNSSLNQIDSRINASLNQFDSHLDASLSQYYDAFDEYGVVVARALSQHDSSILALTAALHTSDSSITTNTASIASLGTHLQSVDASISALRNDVSVTNNKIVIYDSSLRADVSTLETDLEKLSVAISIAEKCGVLSEISNPEYKWVMLDSSSHILMGIKQDNTVYLAATVNEIVDAALETYTDAGATEGTFANKPTSPNVGQMYFCTDKTATGGSNNGVPIWWNGTNWVDAIGNTVS